MPTPGITEIEGVRRTTFKVQIRRAGHSPISKNFRTLKAATAFKRKVEGDIENGAASPRLAAKTITLNELIDEYMPLTDEFKDWKAVRTRTGFWRRELGKLSLVNVTSERIAEILDDHARPITNPRRATGWRTVLRSTA